MNKSIIDFLIEAKKETYANSSSNSKTESTRSGSKDYEYQRDNMVFTIHILVVQILSVKKLYIMEKIHQFGE